MKKIALFLCLILSFVFALGCAPTNSTSYTLVCPDGAPALSAYALQNEGVSVTVYPSSSAPQLIGKDIKNKQTDFAILPVNLASQLCASGENYKMVGVLTHGNLYGVSKTDIGLDDIKGKKVGVIQLAGVPGYTFKLLLSSLDIEYTENKDEANENNVYLFQIMADATSVKDALDKEKADLCIIAEPMSSNLVSKYSFIRSVDVQQAYGSFPQAVLVAKTSVLENDKNAAEKVVSAFENFDYVSMNGASAVEWINSKFLDGASSQLSAIELSVTALQKSNIRFSSAQNEKQRVTNYLAALKVFDSELGVVAQNVSDGFFWSNV